MIVSVPRKGALTRPVRVSHPYGTEPIVPAQVAATLRRIHHRCSTRARLPLRLRRSPLYRDRRGNTMTNDRVCLALLAADECCCLDLEARPALRLEKSYRAVRGHSKTHHRLAGRDTTCAICNGREKNSVEPGGRIGGQYGSMEARWCSSPGQGGASGAASRST